MPDSNSRIPASVHAILIAAVALLLWAYWPTWGDLFETWMSDPDYNHGFLVIPIAGWLLWQRRDLLTGMTIRPSWWGLVLLLMAAGVRWIGAEFFFREFEAWSIPFWLGGVVLLFGGWPLLRWSAGSIAFLWFMTPLPGSFTNFISLPLQKASAVLSTWTLHLFAQPAVLRGTTISLGDQMLDVERACSGLRICYGTLALSVAYVVLTRPRLYKSILLIGASVPLAIVANSTRVTLTGLLFQVVSGEKAHGIAHDFSGLLMLPMAVFLLWLFHLCIDRVVAAFERSSYQGSLLILKSVVVMAVIGTGLVFWQMKQSDAAVTTLLQTAEGHETAGRQFEADEQLEDAAREYSKAAGVLSHFCSLRPEDADAAERLAAAAEKLAFTRTNRIRATRLYQAAWELAPDNSELGFKTARLAVMAELYKDAITASETLLLTADGNAEQELEAFRLKRLAMSRDAESDSASRTTWDELAAVMQTGLEDELDPVSSAYQLAVLYREKPLRNVAPDERSAAATDILDKLVADYPQDPLAWFARYSYRRAYPLTASADPETVTQNETPPASEPGSSDSAAPGSEPTPASTSATPVAQDTSADSDLDKAIELAAESKDESLHPIWLAAGDRAVLRKNYPEAEAFYSKATTAAPGHFRAYLQLARLATDPQITADSDGSVPPEQRQVAIETLKRALTQDNLAGEVLLRVELIRQQLRSDDDAQITEAEQQIDRLKTQFSEFPPELGAPLLLNLAITEAECYAELEQPGKAATVLTQALQQEQVLTISGRDGLLSSSWLLLGSCHEKQGNTDEAQRCFDRAIELEPTSVESLWYQAFSAEQANSTNDAINLYRDIADRLGNRPEPWIAVARNELRRQQQLPVNRRDPSEIFRALERARAAGASPPAVAVVEADLWLMNDDAAKALAVLEQVAADNPDNTDIWRRLAAVHLRNGDEAASTEALERFRELSADDPAAAVLLEASLLVDRNMVDEARQLLDQAVSAAVDPDVQRTLVDYYVQLEVTTADLDKAQLLLTEFTDRHPDDVTGLRRLAEFLWGRRDMQQLQQVEQQLQQAEGEGGIYWQELRARRLLQTAMQTTDPAEQKKLVDEARRITEQIKTSPGMQTATLLLQGRLAGLDGRYAEAAAFFESAWNKAPGSGALAAELVFSLMAAGDRAKADRFLQEVGSGVLQSPQLFDMALELRSGVVVNDLRQATGVAREWTQSIGDADSHLRLARVLSLDISPPSIPAEELTELESAYRT
ncbi:MAG: exosortase, partial [Fuerstiella sp.]